VDAYELDTLDWVWLRCAACGERVEVLRLDFDRTDTDPLTSHCCRALLTQFEHDPSEMSSTDIDYRSDAPSDDSPEELEVEFAEAPFTEESDPLESIDPDFPVDDFEARKETAVPVIDNALLDGSELCTATSRRSTAGVVSSIVIHAVLLLILAGIVFHLPPRPVTEWLAASFDAPTAMTPHAAVFEVATAETETAKFDDVALSRAAVEVADAGRDQIPATEILASSEAASTSARFGSVAVNPGLSTGSGAAGEPDGALPAKNASGSVDDWSVPTGSGFGSRSPALRNQIAALSGATPASEAAVKAGLEWLVHHQRQDGSWSLQHTHAGCGDACLPGSLSMECPTAATGLALLSFLGAGHTHLDGDYQMVVQAGLDWLVEQSREGDLRWPRTREIAEGHSPMYAQGAATMALCEAYGMTGDRTLLQACRDSIRFIIEAQDPVGGGWRYERHQTGDTSVVGWQVMALLSARLSGINISNEVRRGIIEFLASVYVPSTGESGYVNSRRSSMATTAIGTLCQMYLKSSFNRDDFKRVPRVLVTVRPARSNEYANYYVSQVLYQLGGDEWEKWNAECRDTLVATQKRSAGHATGSWDPGSSWGVSGGRLYTTCMNVLTLEVYYRHLPLYGDHAFDVGLVAKSHATITAGKESSKSSKSVTGKDSPDAQSPAFVPVATKEPVTFSDGLQDVPPALQPLVVQPLPERLSLFPVATRFGVPLRAFFKNAANPVAKDADGRGWRQYPDASFGMPLIKSGDQTLLHTGGNYGWFQPGEPVFAVGAGLVRHVLSPPSDGSPTAAAGWGHTIVIEHRLPDGTSVMTVSAHLGPDIRVVAGDVVEAGQQIGSIGDRDPLVNGDCEPHLFLGVRIVDATPTETLLAAFAPDASGWVDPMVFLRDHKVHQQPAFRIWPEWDPRATTNPAATGASAPEWSVDTWLRPPQQGREVTELRGQTICLVCVQSSCEASRLLAGIMLQELSERYKQSLNVTLILLQTPMTSFPQNTIPTLRSAAKNVPDNICIGHSGSIKRRAPILDRYGVRATPWTILIAPNGTVRTSGMMTNSAEVARLIDSIANATTN
jgi:murein DD-endopeptidase MepM/ murein hydrolase activator NlpD